MKVYILIQIIFIYEAFVDLNELNNDDDEKTIRIETKIQIFSVIG